MDYLKTWCLGSLAQKYAVKLELLNAIQQCLYLKYKQREPESSQMLRSVYDGHLNFRSRPSIAVFRDDQKTMLDLVEIYAQFDPAEIMMLHIQFGDGLKVAACHVWPNNSKITESLIICRNRSWTI